MLTDGRTMDARVTGILIAHLGAFGSGELKTDGDPKQKLNSSTEGGYNVETCIVWL